MYIRTSNIFCLLGFVFKYICQKLEFMNHKIFLRDNYEIKGNILDIIFLLLNIFRERMHKFMFILVLYDIGSNIFCGCFCE